MARNLSASKSNAASKVESTSNTGHGAGDRKVRFQIRTGRYWHSSRRGKFLNRLKRFSRPKHYIDECPDNQEQIELGLSQVRIADEDIPGDNGLRFLLAAAGDFLA